ncbi:MAG: response regulator [Candidatus Eiseniibacteriota bacterium]
MSRYQKKILLVEDDEDLLQLFDEVLSQAGFSVDKFTDPLKAHTYFEENRDGYDLILSDINMPHISGIELAKNIRKINPFIEVVLMSAFDYFESDLREVELSTFLKKPMHMQQMIDTVKECMARKERIINSLR